MGSNEVYIDGCNVAECEFFQSEYLEDDSVFCEFCTLFYNACLNNPDCYFKQLQRAKADIEELKAEKQDLINYFKLREGGMLEDIQYWKNKAQEQYRELEQYKASKQASYETMQREWNIAVNELRDLKASDKIEFKQFYKAENERLQAENGKLKKALEEIKKELLEKSSGNSMEKRNSLAIIDEVLND